MGQRLYKVVSLATWETVQLDGVFRGAGIDISDGFIHLSAADQVVETVRKHFAGEQDLLLISVDADALGDDLRWEPSRGGALFPHVYGQINLDAVIDAVPLPLGHDGTHEFPKLL